MSVPKLVLDANILIRAIFGKKAYGLLRNYEGTAEFYTPDSCVQEARAKIPEIAAVRKESPYLAESILNEVDGSYVLTLDRSFYVDFEDQALPRIAKRDPNDWPIVAAALLLKAPIWTEDYDFFGCGIATWTTDRVEIYLRDS